MKLAQSVDGGGCCVWLYVALMCHLRLVFFFYDGVTLAHDSVRVSAMDTGVGGNILQARIRDPYPLHVIVNLLA